MSTQLVSNQSNDSKKKPSIAEVKVKLSTLCEKAPYNTDCLSINPYITYLLPIACIIIGAIIGYLLNRKLSNYNHKLSLERDEKNRVKDSLMFEKVRFNTVRIDHITREYILVILKNEANIDYKFTSTTIINKETTESYESNLVITCDPNPTVTKLRASTISTGSILRLSPGLESTMVLVSPEGKKFPAEELVLKVNGGNLIPIMDDGTIPPPNLGVISGVHKDG